MTKQKNYGGNIKTLKEPAIVQASRSLGININRLEALRKNKEISIKAYADGGFRIIAKSAGAQSLITKSHRNTIVDKENLN